MYPTQQQPAGSFLYTAAPPPDSSFHHFTQTFGAPTMGGYTHDLPTPPSSPYVPRQQGGVRLSTVPLPSVPDPVTIQPALSRAHAHALGIDLDMPLPALSPELLGAPATSPPITEIRIVHPSLYSALPQPIFIMAAPEVGYIRIYDVLLAIRQAMALAVKSLPGTKFVGLVYDVARSNRLLRTQDKYQDRTWILMTHDQFTAV